VSRRPARGGPLIEESIMRKHLRNLDRTLATSCLALLTIIVLVQVIMRELFYAPLVGAEELVRYLLICVIFFGSPYAARIGGHIAMVEFLLKFPKILRDPIRFLTLASSFAVFAIIFVSAFFTLTANMNNKTATLSIPFWIFIAPAIIGFFLLAVEYAILLKRFVSDRGGR